MYRNNTATNCIECTNWFLLYNSIVSLLFLGCAGYVMYKLRKDLKWVNIVVILTFCIIIIARYIIDLYMYYECHDN